MVTQPQHDCQAREHRSLTFSALRSQLDQVISQPGKSACFLILDDFTLNHAALSINVSQDSKPLLYALDNHTAQLFIYDANTGRYLRTVDEMGHDPYIIVTPEH